MKHLCNLILLINLVTVHAFVHAAEAWKDSMKLYGREMPEIGEIIPLKSAIETMNNPEALAAPRKISGIVEKVCKKKGCWMVLSDGDKQARITFENYGFFVPPDTGHARAIVYGKLTEETLSEKRAKHFAKDAGQSGANIKGQQKEFSIVASGVYLEKNAVKDNESEDL